MSSTLAIVLTVVFGILLVVGLGALVLYKRFERSAIGTRTIPSLPTVPPQQELSALGILEIKPRARRADTPPAPASVSTPVLSPVVEPVSELITVRDEEAEPEQEPVVSVERDHSAVEPDPPVSPGSASAPVTRSDGRPDLVALLQAIRASAGGYSVCLVRQDGGNRYDVVAIVSEDEHVRAEKSISIHPSLLVEAMELAPVTVKDIGSEETTWEALGYYRHPVSVRQVAVAPVRVPDDELAYLLFIDALAWRDLDDPWQRLLLGQFATLIGTYLASPLPGDAIQKDRLRIRPRREIIAEEIENARTNELPLSLALIYLNRAEAVAGQGVKALGTAERALQKALQEALLDGRLERFGELTYGVFHHEEVSDVEAWALSLQEQLAADTEHLAGGVSIGIALLHERHTTPDALRADATEALREAFETGACTIIE